MWWSEEMGEDWQACWSTAEEDLNEPLKQSEETPALALCPAAAGTAGVGGRGHSKGGTADSHGYGAQLAILISNVGPSPGGHHPGAMDETLRSRTSCMVGKKACGLFNDV